jgi:hypothetical protein
MNDSSHITNHKSPITDYPRVSIIILNWKGWRDTIECLESFYQIMVPKIPNRLFRRYNYGKY